MGAAGGESHTYTHIHTLIRSNVHYITVVLGLALSTSEVELPCVTLIEVSPLIILNIFYFSVLFVSFGILCSGGETNNLLLNILMITNQHPEGNGVV